MAVTRIEDIQPGQKITGLVKTAEDGEEFIAPLRRQTQVRELDVCPGRWRTHVHVNKTDCWDGRTLVKVG